MSNPALWNPRFLCYAAAHGRTPEQQLVHDLEEWPGAKMLGFVLWNSARIREFHQVNPRAFYRADLIAGPMVLLDHHAYDTWLTTWVKEHVDG